MSANPSWEAVGQGMLVLATLWWAWTGYAWLTSVIDPEEGAVRIAMFVAMAALLVVALCVPEAFGSRALAFALSYGVVRAAHIALFVLASREDRELRRSVVDLAISTSIAVGLLARGQAMGAEVSPCTRAGNLSTKEVLTARETRPQGLHPPRRRGHEKGTFVSWFRDHAMGSGAGLGTDQ